MKKLLKYIPVALMVLFVNQSCSDFLDEEFIAGVSAATYYTTPQGLEDAVKATYASSKTFFGVERGFTMTSFGTDIYRPGSDGSHKGFGLYDGQLNPSESYINEAWRDLYQGINQANAVVNRSSDIEGISDELKNERIAEVRFLRAFYYFTLVRTYGDVHLSLEETEGIEIEANRTSQEDIYAMAIIPDLEFAAANLPDEQSEFGRATKPAAEFLLAKAHMTRAYTSFAESDDASTAMTLMTNVINNYNFGLTPDFSSLWELGNESNEEIIWSVQNNKTQVDEGLDGNGNRGHLYFLMEYDREPGMTRDIENGRPWKRFRPTEFLLTLWDRGIDARYDKTFKSAWLANNADNIPTDASGNPLFTVGDTAIYIPGPGLNELWPQSRQDVTRFQVLTNDEYTEKLFPSMNKWIDPSRPNRQHTPGQRDFIVMRLADAYLIRAEARLMLGNTDGAAEDINVVRARGAWPGSEEANMISAGDVDLDFILDERARELVGEGHRWWDLVRTNKLIERVRLHNPDGGLNIQDYHILRPIPQDQIDRTLGGYEQNPGYPG